MRTVAEFLTARCDEGIARCWARAVQPGSAFVRDEYEATKRVVAAVESWGHHLMVEDCWCTCPAATGEREGETCCDDNRSPGPCDCGMDRRVEQILFALAMPYRDHPDYDNAWAEPRI